MDMPPDPHSKDFHDMMDEAARFSDWSMREMGYLRPTIYLLSAGETKMLIPTRLGEFNEDDKDKFVELCKILCVAQRATGVAFTMEGWMAGCRDRNDPCAIPPSQAPDRREVVILFGEERLDGKICPVSRLFYTIRSSNGKFMNLDALDKHSLQAGSMQGRFSRILTTKEAPESMRRVAQKVLDGMGIYLKKLN